MVLQMDKKEQMTVQNRFYLTVLMYIYLPIQEGVLKLNKRDISSLVYTNNNEHSQSYISRVKRSAVGLGRRELPAVFTIEKWSSIDH